jgi:hypothetical protein
MRRNLRVLRFFGNLRRNDSVLGVLWPHIPMRVFGSGASNVERWANPSLAPIIAPYGGFSTIYCVVELRLRHKVVGLDMHSKLWEMTILRRVDATRNMARFYALDVEPTLFGEFVELLRARMLPLELASEHGRDEDPDKVQRDNIPTLPLAPCGLS